MSDWAITAPMNEARVPAASTIAKPRNATVTVGGGSAGVRDVPSEIGGRRAGRQATTASVGIGP